LISFDSIATLCYAESMERRRVKFQIALHKLLMPQGAIVPKG